MARERFEVGRDEGHLVVRDNDHGGRPVIAILPNDRKPDGPLNMAGVCARALNEVVNQCRKKKESQRGA